MNKHPRTFDYKLFIRLLVRASSLSTSLYVDMISCLILYVSYLYFDIFLILFKVFLYFYGGAAR